MEKKLRTIEEKDENELKNNKKIEFLKETSLENSENNGFGSNFCSSQEILDAFEACNHKKIMVKNYNDIQQKLIEKNIDEINERNEGNSNKNFQKLIHSITTGSLLNGKKGKKEKNAIIKNNSFKLDKKGKFLIFFIN